MSMYSDLVYGTEEHRAARRKHVEQHSDMGDDAMELGKMAVGGMITIGVIGAMSNFFHR